jgi:hypothetical protein
MDTYYDINNAYANNGILHDTFKNSPYIECSPNLDEMARQVNNNKKAKSKDIYRQYRNNENITDALNNMINMQADKGTKILPYNINTANNLSVKKNDPMNVQKITGFYSAQGDYSELEQNDNKNNCTEQLNCNNKKHKKKFVSADTKCDGLSGSGSISIETPSDNSENSENSDSSSFSSITWDTKEIDKQIRTKSKFDSKKKTKRQKCMDFDLDSVDSLESLDSGESLLRHIRFCKLCKDKVIALIRKYKTDKKGKAHILDSIAECDNKEFFSQTNSSNKSIVENKESDKLHKCQDDKLHKCQDDKLPKCNGFPQIKEIIIVSLIGFLIILVLDLIIRNR